MRCKWCQSEEHAAEDCRFRRVEAVVTIANGKPVEPLWNRQESCPECGGDGCKYCDSRL